VEGSARFLLFTLEFSGRKSKLKVSRPVLFKSRVRP